VTGSLPGKEKENGPIDYSHRGGSDLSRPDRHSDPAPPSPDALNPYTELRWESRLLMSADLAIRAPRFHTGETHMAINEGRPVTSGACRLNGTYVLYL
jgi:hypothetical protein